MLATDIYYGVKRALLFLFLGNVLFVTRRVMSSRVLLVQNQYINVVVGINDRVKEDPNLIEKLKEKLTEASAFLYSSTNQRAYLKDVHILVPGSWPRRPHYNNAEWEQYDNSDVIIDLPSGDFGNRPYTSKATLCGEGGNYIHLTPTFVLDQTLQRHYGEFDKAFVHEWAHYRWGVFDEYADDDMPQFYINSDGRAEAVRCVLNIKGTLRDPNTAGDCKYGPDGLPNSDCRFFDERTKATEYSGSLMYKQFLPKVTTFCDTGAYGGWKDNLHNRQAPSKHNQQCGGKSVWEVIRNHPEFENGLNPSLDTVGLPETPTFKVVHQQAKRTVIVLDVSASMKGEPLTQLRQAASNLITSTAENGEQIGIVTFSREAKIRSELVTINEQTRSTLVTKLPTDASGGTSVGAGILRAFDVLGISLDADSKSTGNLLVISDGAENIRPLIVDLQDRIATKNIHINTVAIGPTASPNLEVLANLTNGMTFYHTTGTNTLNEAFGTSFNKNKAVHNRPIYLFSDVLTLMGGDTVIREVQIDRSINRNAEFIFGFDPYFARLLSIVVIKPDGSEVTNTADNVVGVLRVKIPSPVQVGNWRFRIRNDDPQYPAKVSVTIQSFSSTSEDPIIATASWNRMAVIPPERQVLYVYVSKGYTPVINAIVIAEVEIAGNMTDAPILTDDGTGADVNKNDGIYSGYFTNFVAEGRYNVKVRVTNKASSTLIAHGRSLGSSKSALPDPLYEDSIGSGRQTQQQESGPFQRVANGGSFTCTGACNSNIDQYPPSRITDLRASLSSYSKKEVVLRFKAPGDDLMYGTAKEYLVFYSTNFNNLYDNIDVMRVTPDLVKEGSLSSPLEAGQEEMFTIIVPQVGDFAYTFTVVAVDDVGNRSPRSNFVTISANDHSGKLKSWVICVILFSIAGILLVGLMLFAFLYRRKFRTLRPEKPVAKDISASEMEKANSLRVNSMTRLDPTLEHSPKKKRAPKPPAGHMSCFEPSQLNFEKTRKVDNRASVPVNNLNIERSPKYENTDFKTYENAMLDNNVPRGHVRSTAFLIEKTNTVIHKI